MEKSAFSLDNFLATVRSTSLARTNKFEVVINTPPGFNSSTSQLVSLYAEQINFPPLIAAIRTYKVWGPAIHRPQSIEYGGEGITAVFHVDRDMNVKSYFDTWLHNIIDKNDYTVSYLRDYATSIDIKQLDEQNNVTYNIQLLDAFPRSMNIMELNNQSQNQTHRLSVTFAYRNWISQPDNRQGTDIPRSIISPDGPPTVDIRPTPRRRTIPSVPRGPIVPSISFGADSPAYDNQDITNISAMPAA